MLESLFNRVAGLKRKGFPMKLLKTSILKNICKQLISFSEIQATNNITYTLAKTLFSILRFKKDFLTFSALQALVPPKQCFFLRLCCIVNISNVSLYSSLKNLNTLNSNKKSIHISNAQNLITGFILQSGVVEINTASQ